MLDPSRATTSTGGPRARFAATNALDALAPTNFRGATRRAQGEPRRGGANLLRGAQRFLYDVTQDPTIPFVVQFGAPIPGLPQRNVQSENKQYGIYLQDDWEVSRKLLLNLGIRYDYEETPSYLDYATPADVIAGINSVDTSPGAQPGQTYAQSLALGGVDINQYISNGHNRSAFDSADRKSVV